MKTVRVVAALIFSEDKQQILIAQRQQHQHQGGLWEFPGGKVEAGESDEQALRRELMEELNIQVGTVAFLQRSVFDYPDKRIELNFFETQGIMGKIHGNEGQLWALVPVAELSNYAFPAANQAILAQLSANK